MTRVEAATTQVVHWVDTAELIFMMVGLAVVIVIIACVLVWAWGAWDRMKWRKNDG